MKETKTYLIQIKNELINNLKESQELYNKTFYFSFIIFISLILIQTLLQIGILLFCLTFLLIYNFEINHYKLRLALFDLLQNKNPEKLIVPKKTNRFFPSINKQRK